MSSLELHRHCPLVVTGKLELPVVDKAAFDLRPQHAQVLLAVIPGVVESCRGMLAFWHASRHVDRLYRCRAGMLDSQLVNEVWLQCSPLESKAAELTLTLKRELQVACSGSGLEGARVRVEIADEAVAFDEQLGRLGEAADLTTLWAQVQEASERAIRDLRLGARSVPDANWDTWACHIYCNILSGLLGDLDTAGK